MTVATNKPLAPAPRKAAMLSAEALDFAPGLLAIQESPPSRMPRGVIRAVGALFLILLVWAIFGKLDIVASAEGQLVPQSYVKIVQPADAGILQEILVREGQSVRVGQVLMRMDTRVANADGRLVTNELALRSLQLRRIDAELAGAALVAQTGDAPDLLRQIQAQYAERRRAHLDALGQQREALGQAQHEYNAAREVMAKLKAVTPILKEQADAYANLGKDGYAGQIMVRDKQREYVEKAQDVKAQESTVASLRAAVAVEQQRLDQVASRYRSELQNERVDANAAYAKLQQEVIKQEHKSGLLELKATHGGIVNELATHTVGAVVSPGSVLLSIVPEDEPLVAEVLVKNDDVGFVFRGQKVKVKLAAYPFAKYGMLEGTVIHLGPDARSAAAGTRTDGAAKTEAAPGSVYRALVSLDSQMLRHGENKLKLVPGMQVIAEIRQGHRTVMEYLLSPVQKAVHDSARER